MGKSISTKGIKHASDDIINKRTKTELKRNAIYQGRVAQSVACLATDASLTADPGVASSIPSWPGTIHLWRLIMK